MTPRRVIIFVVLLAVSAGLFALGTTLRMPDFEVYHTGAVRAASAEPIYRASDQHYQYKYLPAFAILTIPLGVLPLSVAKGVWLVISVGLAVVLIYMSIRILPERRRSAGFLCVSAVVVMGKFYVRELQLGQANLLFAGIALLSVLALRRNREPTAGIVSAASVAVKPYGLILLPWLVARRKIVSIAAMCVGLLIVAALPVARYGIQGTVDLHRAWWQTVTTTTAPNLLNPDNVSLAAMYARWFGAGTLAATIALLTALVLVGLLGFVFLCRRRASRELTERAPDLQGYAFPEGLEFVMILLLIPLLSPQGWDYVLLIATPAVMYLANYSDRLPMLTRILAGLAALTMGLSLFDLMGRGAYGVFMNSGAITICALILIAALGTLRLQGIV